MRKIRRLRRKRNKKQTHLVIGMALALLFVFTAGYAAFGTNISITAKGNLTTEATCTLNHEWTYDYKDEAQEFKVPCTGTYKIELWGASGGTRYNLSSLAGYVKGHISLKRKQQLFVYVGNRGKADRKDTYNGGGHGGYGDAGYTYTSNRNGTFDYYHENYDSTVFGYSGGGATDIRLVSGIWNDFNSLKSRIMVAAGGGGSGGYNDGEEHSQAGGLIGYKGAYYSGDTLNGQQGNGGTQTSGGLKVNKSWFSLGEYLGTDYPGIFGVGGSSDSFSSDPREGCGSGGGGGGYYGGSAGAATMAGGSGHGGGGGSSFISGHAGCNAIDKNSTENNIIHTNQSIHYSGYKFTDTVMIDGAGCRWTTQKTSDCSGMPTHDGTGTMTGNSGNGYAKITLISIG